MLDAMLKRLAETEYIHPETIPGINLYMDQVTTFMEEHLAKNRRRPDDKILTKTMINNYAKNHLLPPPEKKKYTKEHMLLLIFIYYFKNILSISDIQTLLEPLTRKFFANEKSGVTLEHIYQEVFNLEQTQIERLSQDILEKYAQSLSTFQNVPDSDQEELQFFSLICLLSFDVYMKKQMIERMLDQVAAARASSGETDPKSKSSVKNKSDSRHK